jgi:hypothetical protein
MKLQFILFLFYAFTINAQKNIVSGYTIDGNTGEALINVTVYDRESQVSTFTNKSGYFVISLKPKKTKLEFSLIGYGQRIIEVLNDSTVNVSLFQQEINLQEIEITQKSNEKLQKAPLGLITIPVNRLLKIPVLFGEADIIKALALTPGISNGNEGTSGLLVRGGSPEQNLILLDDATVYNTAHLFGIVSIFNPDAIKNVDLYKGGFPARYGGRLSSVLDISMKEGNLNEKKRSFNIGLVSSKALIEGPYKLKNIKKGSYLISARSSYLTPFFLPQIISFKRGKSEKSFNYWLYDINLKANYTINTKSQIYISSYFGNDSWLAQEGISNERGSFKLKWGNFISSLRLNQIIHPKLFFKSIISFSNYNYNLTNSSFEKAEKKWQKNTSENSNSGINDVSNKSTFEYFPNRFLQLKIGYEAIEHYYAPAQLTSSFEISLDSINKKYRAKEFSYFLESDVDINNWLKVNIGFRNVSFNQRGKVYNAFEPRISSNLILPYHISLKLAYSKMNQFVHLLTSNSVGLPNDIWVPSTNKVPPANSQQFSLGFSKTFENSSLEFSAEIYKKQLKNLIDYSEGNNFFASYRNSWENLIEINGIGIVQGLELFLNKTKGPFTGWIAYTLSKSTRKFNEINAGKWYYSNFDRRNMISVTGNYSPEKSKHSFSITWIYQSGQPITVPIAIHESYQDNQNNLQGLPIEIYGDRNNFRMPNYHRLDFSYSIKGINKKNRETLFSIGAYNLYNRNNPYYLDLKWTTIGKPNNLNLPITGLEYKLYKVGVIPILPYFSYSIQIL